VFSKKRTLYDELGLHPNASNLEIRDAWIRLVTNYSSKTGGLIPNDAHFNGIYEGLI
jgi:curved DNA-binding protein CbpA